MKIKERIKRKFKQMTCSHDWAKVYWYENTDGTRHRYDATQCLICGKTKDIIKK